MKIEELKPLISNLEDLYIMKQSSTLAFNEAIKEAAKKAQIGKSSLTKFIKARIDDNIAKENQDANEIIELVEAMQ